MDVAWIDPLLQRLALASAQSLLLVAALLGIQRLWPRLPAGTRCTLWWLASLQLVLGLVWPTPLELPVLPAADTAVLMSAPSPATASTLTAIPSAHAAMATADAMARTSQASHATVPWREALLWLWVSGVLMTLLQSWQGFLQSRRWRKGARVCTRDDVLAIYQDVGAHLGLRTLPPLAVSARIASPQLLGPWHAIVLLPQAALDTFDAEELRMALHHELSHYRRHDLWWGWMPALARHLFFFHPAAHLINREYAFAREAACDEAVVACDPHAAHDYGRLLLRLGVSPRPCAGMAGASPTYRLLKRRLLMLQNTATAPRLLPLALMGAFVMLAALPWRVTARSGAEVAADPKPHAQAAANARPRPAALSVAQAAPAPKPTASPAARATATSKPSASTSTSTSTSTSVTRYGSGGDYAYVLMQGREVTASAESRDFEAARNAQAGSDAPLLWVRKANRAYLIQDAATVKQAQQLWAPVNELGEQQGALGAKQGALGAQQGKLGAQQGNLGSKMGDLGREHAKLATLQVSLAMSDGAEADRKRADIDRQASQLDARQAELSKQQEALGRQQEALGSQQEVLGKQQEELGRRQQAASDQADARMRQLIDQAIARGVAQPVG